MILVSSPPKLFPDSPDWENIDEGVWGCLYDDIQVYIINRFDDEPPGWSAQWGVDEDGEPELENDDVESQREAVGWLRNQFDPKKRKIPKRFAPKLILYGFDFDKWVERWNIMVPDPVPCPECETPRTPTLPFRQGNLRGVLSEPCTCGYDSKAPLAFIATHGDLFREGDL